MNCSRKEDGRMEEIQIVVVAPAQGVNTVETKANERCHD